VCQRHLRHKYPRPNVYFYFYESLSQVVTPQQIICFGAAKRSVAKENAPAMVAWQGRLESSSNGSL
jgi:hypothetical protein